MTRDYIERRGGKRPGSGRKKNVDQPVTYSVDITPVQALLLKEWGGGDISRGLRWLVEVSAPLIHKSNQDEFKLS